MEEDDKARLSQALELAGVVGRNEGLLRAILQRLEKRGEAVDAVIHMSTDEWRLVLEQAQVDVPTNHRHMSKGDEFTSYAETVQRKVAAAYPRVALTRPLSASELPQSEEIGERLGRHPECESVQSDPAQATEREDEEGNIPDSISSLTRVYRLSPNSGRGVELLHAGPASAEDIVDADQDRFKKTTGKTDDDD